MGGRDLDHSFVCAVLHIVVSEAGVVRATGKVPLIRGERERVHSVLTLSITSENVFVLELKELYLSGGISGQDQLAVLSELESTDYILKFENLTRKLQLVKFDVFHCLWLLQRVYVDPSRHTDSQLIQLAERQSVNLH